MITSSQNQLIKYIQKIQTNRSFRTKENKFVIETHHAIKDYLIHQKEDIIHILSHPKETLDIPKNIKHDIVSEDILKKISSTKNPQNVIALIKNKTWDIDTIIKTAQTCLILDQINNPSNLGAIIRNAVAFNVDLICLTKNSTDPTHPESVRAATGNLFQVPICELTKDIYTTLKNNNIQPLFLTPKGRPQSINIKQFPKVALCFGNEAHGIKTDFLCEDLQNTTHVSIPMNNNIDSLNIAVSTGICLSNRYNNY